MPNADEILSLGIAELESASDLQALELIKSRFLGKEGQITHLLKEIGQLPEANRQAFGAIVNQAKVHLLGCYQERKEILTAQGVEQKLSSEALDVSLPGRGHENGSLHPITLTLERVVALFSSAGFEIAEGPEIEDEFHNFEALNIPDHHPARAMQETFYIEGGKMLRSHTSSVQVRYMKSHPPPIRIIAPGRVYRVDSDATHSPMFHQVEGLWVDSEASFGRLKAIMIDFLRHFFDQDDLKIRFRPSFFAFTEPSAEVDLWSKEGWLEVAGCGMVHPQVLKSVGIDPKKYVGWAFGIGLDRFAMLRYGVQDLRHFFDNDLNFLRQFRAESL